MADKHDPTEEGSAGAAHGGSHARGYHGGPHGGGHEEAHEGAPEWLISFADNVVLQMGFFVILLALAMKAPPGAGKGESKGEGGGSGPTAEQLDFALGVRDAFNNPVDPNSSNPNDFLLVQRLKARAGGYSDAEDEGLKGAEHDVQSIRKGGVFGSGGAIPFEGGGTELTDAARELVLDLGRQFRGCRTVLDIRGHCSAAEAFGRDDRGMQLSYDRAFAVAKLMVAEGLAWSQIRVTACADAERVATPVYDEGGHRSNQRVEVVEIDEGAPLEHENEEPQASEPPPEAGP